MAGLFKKIRGRWKSFRGNPFRKNISAGFYDKSGVFHPIRASADYDRTRTGEASSSGRKYKKGKFSSKRKSTKKSASRKRKKR